MLIRPAMFISELLFLEIMLRMVCSERPSSSPCSSALDFLAACEACEGSTAQPFHWGSRGGGLTPLFSSQLLRNPFADPAVPSAAPMRALRALPHTQIHTRRSWAHTHGPSQAEPPPHQRQSPLQSLTLQFRMRFSLLGVFSRICRNSWVSSAEETQRGEGGGQRDERSGPGPSGQPPAH